MIGDRVINRPSYVVKVDEEDSIKLTPESIYNKILSEPESDLGSPDTDNIEVPTATVTETKEETVEEKPEEKAAE